MNHVSELVSTLPGSLNVNPPQWTTAHHNVPPEWLSQEGAPCMIGGRHGTMEIVNGRLVCVVSPAPKGPTEMLNLEAKNPLAHLPMDQQLAHAVTRYDRKQQDAASKKGRYYNQYALGHYLGAAERVHNDIKKGKSVVDAINTHFNGSLANHIHRTLATGGRWKEDIDMDQDVITEGTSLRFSSPSRTQLVKAYVYFDVNRRSTGLGNVKLSIIQGGQGNWFFDVTSHENNQFLDPGRLNRILPADVTVTQGLNPPASPQTASQDEIRDAIREMVDKRIQDFAAIAE